MAQEKKAQADETQDAGVAGGGGSKFGLDRLVGVESLRLTGHPTHVVAGAFADVDDNKTFTQAQAQDRVEKFLAHKDSTGQEG